MLFLHATTQFTLVCSLKISTTEAGTDSVLRCTQHVGNWNKAWRKLQARNLRTAIPAHFLLRPKCIWACWCNKHQIHSIPNLGHRAWRQWSPMADSQGTAASSLNVADFLVKPEGREDWADAAAKIFRSHGFCIVSDALMHEEVSEVLQTCLEVETKMLRLDPDRLGCRDPGRYSFGAASESGHMLHHPAWRHLLQSRSMLMVLQRIFPDGFVFCGGGGDFVRSGTENYQSLHSDLGPSGVPPEERLDNPPPMVSVNFTVQPITADNGPLRVIPSRKVISTKNNERPPYFSNEPEVLRQSKLFPLSSGAAIIRDLRLWHGGTPNTSLNTRFLPSVEIMSVRYSAYVAGPHSFGYKYCDVCKWHHCSIPYKNRTPCLPESLFLKLRKEVQELCQMLRAPDVPTGLRNFAHAQRSWEQSWKSWPRQSETQAIQASAAGFQRSSQSGPQSSQREWQPWHEVGNWKASTWNPRRGWHFQRGEKGEKSNMTFQEGIAATGAILAKAMRVTFGIFVIVKTFRLLNRFSMALDSNVRLRLLKALPPVASDLLAKIIAFLSYL